MGKCIVQYHRYILALDFLFNVSYCICLVNTFYIVVLDDI